MLVRSDNKQQQERPAIFRRFEGEITLAYFLGIDGGGTKTRFALADETTVLARAICGGSNIIRLGEAQARSVLRSGVEQVTTAARIPASRIYATCIGVAGAARAEIAAKVGAILADLSLTNVEIVGDTVIALESAFGRGPGLIAIAGTGSIVYARDASGRLERAGGWGFAVSDEGSGHWIGKKAVSAVLNAHDEGRQTLLSNLIFKAWNLHSLDDLVQQANATPPPEFPRMFPAVLRAADEGDAVAKELLEVAGRKLAGLVATVMRKFDRQSVPGLNVDAEGRALLPVATTGSVFRQSSHVRESFRESLKTKFPGIAIQETIAEPIKGALARARTYRQPGQISP